MYTQITKELHEQLQANAIASSVMGSHAHGLQCESSDRDHLILYFDPSFGSGIHWESNGWQYKTETCDYNYQEIRVFIRNMIIGDSPSDYEALRHGFNITINDVNKNILNSIMYDLSINSNSYTLIKSYLGYLKKDCNSVSKILDENCPIDSIILRKKLSHIIRGISTITHLIDNTKPYLFDGNNDSSTFNFAKRVKCNYVTSDEAAHILFSGIIYEEETRNVLNTKLNNGHIIRRMRIHAIETIDNKLKTLIAQFNEANMFKPIDFGDLEYQIIANGTTFQYKK